VLRLVQPVHPDAKQRVQQDRQLRRAPQPEADDQHGEEGERDRPVEVAEAAVSSRWPDGVSAVRVEVGRASLCDLRDSVRRRDGYEAEVEGGKSGRAVLFWRLRAHAPPTMRWGCACGAGVDEQVALARHVWETWHGYGGFRDRDAIGFFERVVVHGAPDKVVGFFVVFLEWRAQRPRRR